MAQTALLWSYSNKTLQGNWCEDRIQAPENVGYEEFLKTKQGPDTTRCIPVHTTERDYTTSSSQINGLQHEKVPPTHKAMVGGDNFHEIHTVRATGPEKGFGAVLPAHPESHFTTYRETTYNAMYEEQPAEAKKKPPPPEQGDDTRFRGGYPANCNPAKHEAPVYSTSKAFFRSGLQLDLDTEKRQEMPRGSYGTRGHLTRAPEESGSRSAKSIFADEYALGK